MAKVFVAAVAAGIAISLNCSALAEEDYPFVAELLPPHLAERAAGQSGQLLLASFGGASEYFITAIKTWDTAQPIKVCFFGGTAALRGRIAQVALEWTKRGGYVPLDFGNLAQPRTCSSSERSQIRVGFQYKGYWSTVGTDSVNLAAQYEQSMNFALFDVNPPPEPGFSRVVLHEFGHALGFQHEHQSETAPCSTDFDWDAVYAYLKGPPNYWSVEQIDHNLRPIKDPGNVSSPFDRASIMLYSFPQNFYKNGTNAACYTPGNNAISTTDVSAILRFYPANVAAQAQVQRAALDSFFLGIDALANVSQEQKSLAKLTAAGLSKLDNRIPAFTTTKQDFFMLPDSRDGAGSIKDFQYLTRIPKF